MLLLLAPRLPEAKSHFMEEPNSIVHAGTAPGSPIQAGSDAKTQS